MYHLVCQKEDRLQAELVVAMVENIFKGQTKLSKDKGIVITFCSKPLNREDVLANETLVYLKFIWSWGSLTLVDSNLIATSSFKIMLVPR